MKKQRRNWNSLVREQERSGLSVKEFCEQRGLSISGFYQKRKRVAETPAFLPALVEDFPSATKIILRRGEVSIEVPPAAPSTLISSLITALQEAAC